MKTRAGKKSIDFVDAIRESGKVRQKEVLSVDVDDDEDGESEDELESDDDLNQFTAPAATTTPHADVDDNAAAGSSDEDDAEDGDGGAKKKPYLPGASASWGKHTAAYYHTDYVDEDFGGFGSGSEEENADLEEETALEMQRQLAERANRAEDYGLDELMIGDDHDEAVEKEGEREGDQSSPGGKKSRVKSGGASAAAGGVIGAASEGELKGIVDEFNEKLQEIQAQLEPVLTGVSAISNGPETGGMDGDPGGVVCPLKRTLLQFKYEIYSNYLININFYLVLRAGNTEGAGSHPCIDRIIQWRKLISVFDSLPESDLINAVLTNSPDMQNQPNGPGSCFESLMILFQCAVENNNSADNNYANEVNKLAKKGRVGSKLVGDGGQLEEGAMNEGDEGEQEEEEAGGKRGLTYTISKNKGILPKRKKEQRNPRVKHKLRFRKALIRKRSQMPDVRTEVRKYDGEVRGIKTHVVRRIQLKG